MWWFVQHSQDDVRGLVRGNAGDPTIAVVEKGVILVDTLVDEVAEFMEDLKKL